MLHIKKIPQSNLIETTYLRFERPCDAHSMAVFHENNKRLAKNIKYDYCCILYQNINKDFSDNFIKSCIAIIGLTIGNKRRESFVEVLYIILYRYDWLAAFDLTMDNFRNIISAEAFIDDLNKFILNLYSADSMGRLYTLVRIYHTILGPSTIKKTAFNEPEDNEPSIMIQQYRQKS